MPVCDLNTLGSPLATRKQLEIIVTSRQEALEAEAGGADRLEIVRSLELGGLTPSVEVVRDILDIVSVPVRVMLRESNTMSITDHAELDRLVVCGRALAALPIAGLVLGFVRNGSVDESALERLLPEAHQLPVTFHRAFEHLDRPLAAIAVLKKFPQIDRILIRVRDDGNSIDLATARNWQHFASPRIQFVLGIGLSGTLLHSLREDPFFSEIHVGRGARELQKVSGPVSRLRVAQLKSALS